LAAGVDLDLIDGLQRAHASGHPKIRIRGEVAQAGERRPGSGRDRRLRVGAEELVAPAPKFAQGVGAAQPVEVAHPPAPVNQVEVLGHVHPGQDYPGRGGPAGRRSLSVSKMRIPLAGDKLSVTLAEKIQLIGSNTTNSTRPLLGQSPDLSGESHLLDLSYVAIFVRTFGDR